MTSLMARVTAGRRRAQICLVIERNAQLIEKRVEMRREIAASTDGGLLVHVAVETTRG